MASSLTELKEGFWTKFGMGKKPQGEIDPVLRPIVRRRGFLKATGLVVGGGVLVGCIPGSTRQPGATSTPRPLDTPVPATAVPEIPTPLPIEVDVAPSLDVLAQLSIKSAEMISLDDIPDTEIRLKVGASDNIARARVMSELGDPRQFMSGSYTFNVLKVTSEDNKPHLVPVVSYLNSQSSKSAFVAIVTNGTEINELSIEDLNGDIGPHLCLSYQDKVTAVSMPVFIVKSGGRAKYAALSSEEKEQEELALFSFDKLNTTFKIPEIAALFNQELKPSLPAIDISSGPPEFDITQATTRETTYPPDETSEYLRFLCLERVYRAERAQSDGKLSLADEKALQNNYQATLKVFGANYEVFQAYNGGFGDDFRLSTFIARQDVSGQTQLYWTGNKDGALNDRPDLPGVGYWIPVPKSSRLAVQFDGNVPYVFALDGQGNPVAWWNPAGKRLEGQLFAGNWVGYREYEQLKVVVAQAGESYKLRFDQGTPTVTRTTIDGTGKPVVSDVLSTADGKTVKVNYLKNDKGVTPTIYSDITSIVWDQAESTLKITNKDGKSFIYYEKSQAWIEADRIIPGGMAEWRIPITEEIKQKLDKTSLSKTFDHVEKYIGGKLGKEFRFLWGEIHDAEPFNISLKDGTKIGTAIAWSPIYFYDINGKPTAAVIPIVTQIANGKLIQIQNNRFLSSSDWENLSLKYPARFSDIYSRAGRVGTVTIASFKVFYEKDKIDESASITAYNLLDGPFRDSWREAGELDKLFDTGDTTGLQVLVNSSAREGI